jgi:hypothetical protein
MGMKLQEFVNETLREIIAGVKQAQAYAVDNGALVNPRDYSGCQEEKPFANVPVGEGWERTPIKEIDFDVAVTSTDTAETQAGAGVFVAALGFGVRDKSDTVNSCVSRIKFSVPLALPMNKSE